MIEALLGAGPLGASGARLPAGGHDAADQRQSDKRSRNDGDLVALDELRRAIAPCILPRDHRPAFQMAADVFREQRHRAIAPLRLFAQRHHDNVVQIALPQSRVGDGGGRDLADQGVAGVLADPTLELVDANGSTVRENDNWKAAQLIELELLGIQPKNDAEAALSCYAAGR